jgi:glycosyltransferase involved in cell wall biosynthesis
MRLSVLMNAGPWLPVPPVGYGGVENVVASLVPELRRRGVRVLLCSVGSSSIPVDHHAWTFQEGQFPQLAGPFDTATAIARAHMECVLDTIRDHPDIDIIHDHLEGIGPTVLSALGPEAPPVLQTLHWDLGKRPDFYASFDGRGRVFFNGVSATQLARAPERLRSQTLGVVHLGVNPEAFELERKKHDHFVILGRLTRAKGTDVAARLSGELGRALCIAGPVGGLTTPEELDAALADPASPFHHCEDVRFYLDHVRPYEDGARIRWIGSVDAAAKRHLVSHARAVLAPIRWDEPGATAAIEALAWGTPIIAMRHGALGEIVQDGVNGFLVDDERAFARAMLRIDEIDPRACRRSVEERFTASAMAEAYLKLYQDVVTRTAPGRRNASSATV